MGDFYHNVFVNGPFDTDYRELLLSLIFTIKYLGFQPRLSLERADSAETRIDKIVGLINESKFGIHDLSRIVSTEKDEHCRMNMPFELGIDYGCQKLKGEKWAKKQILILEKEQYRYQKALSDLSGSDIRKHDDDPMKLIKVVRDWFVTVESIRGADSGKRIWDGYNDFQAFLYNEIVENAGHESVDEIPIPELIQYMSDWFESKESAGVSLVS